MLCGKITSPFKAFASSRVDFTRLSFRSYLVCNPGVSKDLTLSSFHLFLRFIVHRPHTVTIINVCSFITWLLQFISTGFCVSLSKMVADNLGKIEIQSIALICLSANSSLTFLKFFVQKNFDRKFY